MSLGNMVPGSGIDPDWRAIGVGAAVLGALCLVPVLGGWLEMPTPTAESVTAAAANPQSAGSTEGPGILGTGAPFLIGVPGPFVAGYLARTSNLEGALEGAISVPLAAVVPVVGAMVHHFLLFQGAGVGWQIEMVWRGVGFWAVTAVPFMPLVCALGAALGWLGALANDAVGGGVTVSWS